MNGHRELVALGLLVVVLLANSNSASAAVARGIVAAVCGIS